MIQTYVWISCSFNSAGFEEESYRLNSVTVEKTTLEPICTTKACLALTQDVRGKAHLPYPATFSPDGPITSTNQQYVYAINYCCNCSISLVLHKMNLSNIFVVILNQKTLLII